MKLVKLVAENMTGADALYTELKRARYTILQTHTVGIVTTLVLGTLRDSVETARQLIMDYSTHCEPVHLTEAEFARLSM
jgi:hypothetical protein